MGKLKLEAQRCVEQDRVKGQKIVECGEQEIEEARLNSLPLGHEGVSLIDELERIDDDDLAAIEAARSQAEDVAGMSKHFATSRFPLSILEPPQDFSSESLSSSDNLAFQGIDEIEDESLQEDSELQLEFERLAKALEDFS